MIGSFWIAVSLAGAASGQLGNLPQFNPPPVRSSSAPPTLDIPHHPHGFPPLPEKDGNARLFLGATLSEVQAIMGDAEPHREPGGDILRYRGAGCDIIVTFGGGKVSDVVAGAASNSEPYDLLTCVRSARGDRP
mgnify:CR=1 FL=1